MSKAVTRTDLANHFASYNRYVLLRLVIVGGLNFPVVPDLPKLRHYTRKWVRSSPDGALSSQCQELNALHSQSVDGARIKIPDRLLTPPESDTPYIIALLASAAEEFSNHFLQSHLTDGTSGLEENSEDDKELIRSLLQSSQNALSEYELFNIAFSIARRHSESVDFRPYLAHLDIGALTTQEKYALSSTVDLTPEDDSYIWNSLLRSDILTSRDLEQRQLNKVLPLQRLYSSKIHGLAVFFQYLCIATQEFTRKLLVIKVLTVPFFQMALNS